MSDIVKNSSLIYSPNTDFVKIYRIPVKKYDLMIESGIFNKYDKIELLNGLLIEKHSKTPRHAFTTDKITLNFFRTFGDDLIVRNQNPIWLDEFSEPEPDIVLAMPKDDEYETTHPTPSEIFLILEVSDTTLRYDRNDKCLAYARAEIRQYLLLNVQDKTIEDYREPSADGYQSKQTFRAGQSFNLVAFPENTFKVEDFLPIEKS